MDPWLRQPWPELANAFSVIGCSFYFHFAVVNRDS
jgi:hypothetical protein